jgi:hypothetical protein
MVERGGEHRNLQETQPQTDQPSNADWLEYRERFSADQIIGELKTLKDISKETGLSTSGIHRLVRNGIIRGVWATDPQSGRSVWWTTVDQVEDYREHGHVNPPHRGNFGYREKNSE